MPTGYSQVLSDCARILSGKVKFSNALSALGPDTRNKGTILLASSGITMDSAYCGKNIRFEFRFSNPADLTQYQLWKQAVTDGPKNMLYIGTGSTVLPSTFAGMFTIAPAGWSGAALLDDLIILITDSNMSLDDADATMNDIEAAIDDRLRREAIIISDEGTIPTDLYFVLNPPVPRQITVSASYAFCYRIVNDLMKAGRSLKLPSAKEEAVDDDFSLAYQWKKEADKALNDYIATYIIQKAGNAPRWSGWAPLQSAIGIKNQGDGEFVVGEDEDYTSEENQHDAFGLMEDKLTSSTTEPTEGM